jgi:hypothetical protein
MREDEKERTRRKIRGAKDKKKGREGRTRRKDEE